MRVMLRTRSASILLTRRCAETLVSALRVCRERPGRRAAERG
jgi:hypothetical protein